MVCPSAFDTTKKMYLPFYIGRKNLRRFRSPKISNRLYDFSQSISQTFFRVFAKVNFPPSTIFLSPNFNKNISCPRPSFASRKHLAHNQNLGLNFRRGRIFNSFHLFVSRPPFYQIFITNLHRDHSRAVVRLLPVPESRENGTDGLSRRLFRLW